MKLRSKLTILVLLTTLTALCAGGGFFMGRMREYTLAMVVESEQEKLTAIENAFRQVGSREDFENMGELARDAYMVQKLGEKHVLLLKKTLEYPAGFEVLAAKDISDFWDGFEGQVWTLAAGFLLLALAGSALTALAAGRLLKGLGKLKDAVAAQVEDLHLLLGALAHEMKTPVTSIIGYADSLLHVRLSEEQQARSLRCIYDAGRRMETMSAKFLALLEPMKMMP